LTLDQVSDWLLIAPLAVSFAASFVGGTVVTIVLATFAGTAGISWWPILAGASLGNLASDACWFALAGSRLADRIRNSAHFRSRAQQITRLREHHRRRDVFYFIAIKFAYGLRIAQILVLGAVHYPWSRFLRLDGLAVAVINAAAVAAGWSFGRGATRYLDLFRGTGRVVTAVTVALLVFLALRFLINRYALRKP
jgi:membrane protein DedA with SNARE-associated domain